MNDDSEKKRANGTKKCVIKRILKFNYQKDCLLNNKIKLKLEQRFNSDYYKVDTDEINKTALSNIDNKRFQTFDKIITYLYGTNGFKLYEIVMLSEYK